jgi:SNF2 family DNA or RNA helicase
MLTVRFERLGVDMLVVDESSKFKHSQTKRFKLLKNVLQRFKRRIILTGSPNPNGYLDLFGQIYILDMGRSLGRYVTHYRMNFFRPTGYGGYTWVLKENGEQEIQEAIRPLIMRIDTSDYVDLPAIVDNVIRVDLPEKARKVYEELEEDMLAVLEGGKTVTAVSAGAASNKCSQVANGGIYYSPTHEAPEEGAENRRETVVVHDAKTEALVDLVDELQGAPLLVAYEFQHDLERITKALGKNTPFIGGGVSPKRTAEIVAAWNAGRIPILLAHPAAMGHGLNLQKSNCRHVCWYGITWDYELYDQFIRRVRRPGNKSADVFNHHIVARSTVDEAKMRALRSKGKTQKALLDALKVYARSRRRKN